MRRLSPVVPLVGVLALLLLILWAAGLIGSTPFIRG